MRIYPVLLAMTILIAGCQSSDSTDTTVSLTGYPDIDQITMSIQEHPEDHRLYRQRAVAYADREAYDQAILDLKRVLTLDSMDIESYHLLADVYLDYYDSRMAINTLYSAVERFPNRIPTLLKLVEFQFILKFYDPAKETLARIMTLDPQNAEGLFWAGMIHREEGNNVQAIKRFQEATEQDPDLIDAWIECGKLLSQEKKPLALRYFETAVRLDSTSDHARHALAEYLQDQGRYQDALDVYRDLVLRNPQYADAIYNSGLIYLEMDSLQDARKQFDLALKVDPTRSLAYFARGNVLEQLGDLNGAISDYKQALVLDPSMERAKKALAQLQQTK
ncbi:MAG: tetratricopeptide repeat protein [Saprospiraceae bacterium]|nr:tetratricopeptide repeat protein [Saprospiraceae bacterium]